MKKNTGLKFLQLRNYSYVCFGIVFLFLLSSVNLIAQNNGETNQRSVSDSQNIANQKLRNELSLSDEKKKDGKKQNPIELEEFKKAELEKTLFGYNIFHNKNVKFEPNLNMATPKGYVVGPKDELVLQVFGVAQNKYDVIVSNEGRISIPDIGVAQIGGLTIEAVQSLLTQKMSLRYAGMRGSNPNTFLQVSLSNIRTIKVNMVGEIGLPGTYSLPSYVNVFNALFAAGGPTIKGTFRAVQVYRNNRQVAEIDLYDFIVNGKISQNVRLEDNDVILVRPSTSKVIIKGEVRIPGIFELKNGETFKDLLKYAGGFSENAYKQMVGLTRKGIIDNQVVDIVAANFGKIAIIDGDYILVNPIQDKISNRVQISGSVAKPGQYEWISGMRVRDLVQKAGGFKGDAFLKNVLIFRRKYDLTQEVISVNLSTDNQSDTINNILLQKEDVVSLKSITDLRQEYYVQVSGQVNNTGIYPFNENMTVNDLILQAGGFKYSASSSFIEIARRTLENPNKVAEIIQVNSNNNLINADSIKKIRLLPFDHIFIRNIPGYYAPYIVTIKGEVLLPGDFAVDRKEMRISDLIKRANGLSQYAYTPGATLLRRTNKFKNLTKAEKENENLNEIKLNINKDQIAASSETNKSTTSRIDEKVAENNKIIGFEKEEKLKEAEKQAILKDNLLLKGKNTIQESENEQELVAIDLDQIIANPGSNYDLILKEGDVLDIPEKIQTVSVKGGVLYPVSVRYEEGIHFKEYINRSGGYSLQAIRKKSYVIQSNGKVERVKQVLFVRTYPKIKPGAQIFVPINTAEKAPLSYDKALGIITSTLTLIFLLRAL